MTSYELLQYDDCYIELLEDYPCNNKNQLHRREGELIREHDCVNKYVAGRNKAEYYQNNKEQISAQMKLYHQNNKEKILARKKHRINCDYCDCTFTWSNKIHHIKTQRHIDNYKAAYLECWGEEFTGTITLEDY